VAQNANFNVFLRCVSYSFVAGNNNYNRRHFIFDMQIDQYAD